MRPLAAALAFSLSALANDPALLGKWEVTRHYDGHQQLEVGDVWVFSKESITTKASSTPMSYETSAAERTEFTYWEGFEQGLRQRRAPYEIRDGQLRILRPGPDLQGLPSRIRPTDGFEYLVLTRDAAPQTSPSPQNDPPSRPRSAATGKPHSAPLPPAIVGQVARVQEALPGILGDALSLSGDRETGDRYRSLPFMQEPVQPQDGHWVIGFQLKPSAEHAINASFTVEPFGAWSFSGFYETRGKSPRKKIMDEEGAQTNATVLSALTEIFVGPRPKHSLADPELLGKWLSVEKYLSEEKVDSGIGSWVVEESQILRQFSWGQSLKPMDCLPGDPALGKHFWILRSDNHWQVVSYHIAGDKLRVLFPGTAQAAPVRVPKKCKGGLLATFRREGVERKQETEEHGEVTAPAMQFAQSSPKPHPDGNIDRFLAALPAIMANAMTSYLHSERMAKMYGQEHAKLESIAKMRDHQRVTIMLSPKPLDPKNGLRTTFEFRKPDDWRPVSCKRYENGTIASDMFEGGIFGAHADLRLHLDRALREHFKLAADPKAELDSLLLGQWQIVAVHLGAEKIAPLAPTTVSFSQTEIVTENDLGRIVAKWRPGGTTPVPHYYQVGDFGPAGKVELLTSYQLKGDKLTLANSQSPTAQPIQSFATADGVLLTVLTRGAAQKSERPPAASAALATLKQAGASFDVNAQGEVVTVMLSNLPVTDAQLTLLRDLPQLDTVSLTLSEVRDKQLPLLNRIPKLRRLNLSFTRISDQGSPALYSCKALRQVILANCLATKTGAKRLQNALPKCDVQLELAP
ncbi:MAG: hypothetical protein ACI8W8_003695 [Rhodothermales bacterium]|jgi:hypothetical protein